MVEELGHGDIPPADGSFAIAQARRAEALAFAEFTRVMRVYADLVVHGKLPPPDGVDELLI